MERRKFIKDSILASLALFVPLPNFSSIGYDNIDGRHGPLSWMADDDCRQYLRAIDTINKS